MPPIPVNRIRPNPQQPRTHFDPVALEELAASIQENGLQNPILVEDNSDGSYTLVSGERRWRAHQLLGLELIEAILRPPTNHSGKKRLVDAMIENVQRESMSPVEEAHGYLRMKTEYGMKSTEIARAVGKPLNSILQRLKITELEPVIQQLIAEKKLPGSQQAVEALLTIPAGSTRLKLAQALATRSATIKMVQSACHRLAKTLTSPTIQKEHAPAVAIGMKIVKLTGEPPEWDALYQVDRVPPWPVFTEQVMATCDACGLRPVASDATCRDCPLVDFVRRILEQTK